MSSPNPPNPDSLESRSPEPAEGRIPNPDVPGGGAARRIVIAIDGPSGAGKGTVAREVARRLGYHHIDTGAMYRALAWRALDAALDLTDEDAVTALAGQAVFEMGDGLVRVDGHDVARAIRTPEIDQAVSAVARQPRVRQVLVDRQRALGAGGGVVMEGRDIGTVVFPRAEVKIYLDASADERARRRANDAAHTAGRGAAALQEVASALEARDRSDRTRAASPLTVADDALVIDTTGVPVEDVVGRILDRIAAR